MKLLLAFLLVATPTVASAHDFWMEPSTFQPAVGSKVSIRLRVGEHYLGDPIPRKAAENLLRFEAYTANRTVPVTGAEGDDPAGTLIVAEDGLVLIAYQNTPAFVELSEEKLRQYLREEGLEWMHEKRARSPFARQPWREIYSRCSKLLLRTGPGSARVFNKRVGMPLELIPEKDPYAFRLGSTLPILVLYEGKPLPAALIVAISKSEPRRQLAVRSDAQGRVRLKLFRAGEWTIKAVHMKPATAGAKGQWESLWASLTFELAQ